MFAAFNLFLTMKARYKTSEGGSGEWDLSGASGARPVYAQKPPSILKDLSLIVLQIVGAGIVMLAIGALISFGSRIAGGH